MRRIASRFLREAPRRLLVPAALLAAAAGLLPAATEEPELPGHLVWPPHLRHLNVPAPGVFPGIEGESRFETNAWGIRGPEFGGKRKDEYRILVLGGSAAECFYLDQDETWPALLGARLPRTADRRRVWVGNIGRSGHNSRDHVMEMRLLVPHLPVDAIVVMMGVNDLGVRLAQDAAHNPDFLATEENVAYQIKHAFTVLPDDPNIAFYRKGVLGRLLGADENAARKRPHQVVDGAGRVFDTWRDYRRTGISVEALPPMDAALAEYGRHAAEIARRGRDLGLRVIFVTQPALWRADLGPPEIGTLWMGGIGDYQAGPGSRYYTPGALAAGLERYNRALLEVCAAEGIECLDLASSTVRDQTVFYDDCHFNEGGARSVAASLAAWLAERPPFRDAGTSR